MHNIAYPHRLDSRKDAFFLRTFIYFFLFNRGVTVSCTTLYTVTALAFEDSFASSSLRSLAFGRKTTDQLQLLQHRRWRRCSVTINQHNHLSISAATWLTTHCAAHPNFVLCLVAIARPPLVSRSSLGRHFRCNVTDYSLRSTFFFYNNIISLHGLHWFRQCAPGYGLLLKLLLQLLFASHG